MAINRDREPEKQEDESLKKIICSSWS